MGWDNGATCVEEVGTRFLIFLRHYTSTNKQMNRPFEFTGRIRSFKYAFKGIWTMIQSQHNVWVHALATVAVVGAGLYFEVERDEWMWLILAHRSRMERRGPQYGIRILGGCHQPNISSDNRNAKDVAAAAVLIAAIGAVIIGILILGPHLLQIITE